jgi:hypothetical protein
VREAGGEGRGQQLSAGTYVLGVGGEAEAGEREVGGCEEAAMVAPIVGAEGSDAASASSVSGEPAAHLEDPGGRGAGRRQQQQQRSERGEAEEEEGGVRRWRGHRLLVGKVSEAERRQMGKNGHPAVGRGRAWAGEEEGRRRCR